MNFDVWQEEETSQSLFHSEFICSIFDIQVNKGGHTDDTDVTDLHRLIDL